MKTSILNFEFTEQKALRQIALVFIFTLLISFPLLAQTAGEIKGKVIDKVTKESIPGANVYVEVGGSKVGSSTDMDGKFTIKPLPPGTYNLYISFISYNTYLLTSITVNSGKITFIKDAALEQASTELGPFIVKGEKHEDLLLDPEKPSAMGIKGPEIQKSPARGDVTAIVASITSDVKLSDDGKSMHIRGTRSGSEGYYVDGVLINSLSNVAPGMSIKSMEVYTGGIPAQYGDITSGVVVIQTLSYFDLYNEWMAKLMYEEHLKDQEEREKKAIE